MKNLEEFPVGCYVKYVGAEYIYPGCIGGYIAPFVLKNGDLGMVTSNHRKNGITININRRDLAMSKKAFTDNFEKIEEV